MLGGNMSKREQVTVPLPTDLRDYVERVAVREDRTVASTIRHFIAERARRETTPAAETFEGITS
jgi:hypothetical protein